MSGVLRVTLILMSVFVFFFVMKKIRKAQLNIDDSIYWIFFAFLILVLSIFPGIAVGASQLLKIESPANFVFLFISFMIIIKLFQVSIDCSVLKHRLNHLVQKSALINYEQEQINLQNSEKQTDKIEK